MKVHFPYTKKAFVFGFLFLAFMEIPMAYAQRHQPVVSLRAEPLYFSPNNDEIRDQVFFYPVLQSNAEVFRWRLDIKNARGTRVVRLTGAGFPALIKWDGMDRKGRRIGEGVYEAEFTTWGKGFRVSASASFRVDLTPPQVQIAVSTPVLTEELFEVGGLLFTGQVTDASSLEVWQFQVLDERGQRTLFVDWSSGTLRSIKWDGKDQTTKVLVPPGVYRCAFQAWDKAGNMSTPQFLEVRVVIEPRDMLIKTLKKIRIVESTLGLLVQFNARDLFGYRKGKPFLKSSGAELLKEAALLINAYSGVPVKLDGYSDSQKNAAIDREQASLYAWKAYSYLVKTGHVTGSRLGVRGRGRSAMFDRRSVDYPVVTNGVEIILEGEGPW